MSAFTALRSRANSCPQQQKVPAKKKSGTDSTFYPHDDTWKVTENPIAGWSHFRGFEKHVEPRVMKYNVYFLIYDYAVRGNLVVASLYWERNEPGESGDPIAERATELLTRQLRKFG
ncbi:hypothetical protein DFJ69_1430 [Thermomonospora umbrina]|uniref:Uncharacterized protein n=2 Tax=Thermomonospora umbrina TaxID=111806 RepID=A0A3D9SNJ4_9ACTN|nr:hypothetical protein DFJ69_1430 [Thermomonospora umbrina]